MIASAATLPSLSENDVSERFHQLVAQFWLSPFAISSASVITAELMLLMGKSYGGLDVSMDVFMALTFIAAAMLVAGTLPAWNCLKWDDRGLDQHAGLTHFHVDWDQVKSVSPAPGGLKISYVSTEGDHPVVRRGFIQNRYAVSGNEFRKMIEQSWLEKAALAA